MNTSTLPAPWSSDSETDLQLVERVALFDVELARQLQRRLHLLRLMRVVNQPPADSRHSIWHSLRHPWGRRG